MTTYRTKAAFLRGAMSVAKKFAPNVASQAGKLLHSPAVGGNLATHGLKKTVLDYAKGGAGFGALAGGALGAYGAEDGHRLEGAVRGAIPMAMQGAIGGAASGLITQPMRNLRQHAMAAKYDGATAKRVLDSTWRGNLKGMVADKGSRGAHAMEALAAPATVAADMYVGDKLMGMLPGGGHEQPAQQPPQRPQAYPQQVRVASALEGPQELAELPPEGAPRHIEPFIVSPFTATAGKVVADSATSRFLPHLPEKGSLRKHVLPTIGAAALTIPAVTAVRAYNAAQVPAAPNPLDELDVDALKMYFGKQPASQGDHHADRNH